LDAAQFSATARSIKPNQQAKITFKASRDGIMTLGRLTRAYCGRDGFDIAPKDRILASAVISSMNWDGDQNRTIQFVGVEKLDDNTLYMISRDADKIVVV
jgi:hypothetical protein